MAISKDDSEMAYELMDLQWELDLDCLQERVTGIVGEDEAEEILLAIANLDFELEDTVRRLIGRSR